MLATTILLQLLKQLNVQFFFKFELFLLSLKTDNGFFDSLQAFITSFLTHARLLFSEWLISVVFLLLLDPIHLLFKIHQTISYVLYDKVFAL
jgi:hypothetical protein